MSKQFRCKHCNSTYKNIQLIVIYQIEHLEIMIHILFTPKDLFVVYAIVWLNMQRPAWVHSTNADTFSKAHLYIFHYINVACMFTDNWTAASNQYAWVHNSGTRLTSSYPANMHLLERNCLVNQVELNLTWLRTNEITTSLIILHVPLPSKILSFGYQGILWASVEQNASTDVHYNCKSVH